jgi:hypothetical protein
LCGLWFTYTLENILQQPILVLLIIYLFNDLISIKPDHSAQIALVT